MSAEVYFIFVMLLCGASLAVSIVVMNIHNRSSVDESSLAMSAWVILERFEALLLHFDECLLRSRYIIVQSCGGSYKYRMIFLMPRHLSTA